MMVQILIRKLVENFVGANMVCKRIKVHDVTMRSQSCVNEA